MLRFVFMAGRGGGGHTMNSMLLKPTIRKLYHKKVGETARLEAEEVKSKSLRGDGEKSCSCSCWVPHERTGIYYPKGQEKLMDDVPVGAAKDAAGVNWFHYNDHVSF